MTEITRPADLNRRKLAQAVAAGTALAPFTISKSYAQAHKGEIVIGASQIGRAHV